MKNKNKKTNRTGETFSMKNQKDLNNVRWKVVECDTKNCWCACIYPEVTIKDEEGDKRFIVGSGCIPKENAEHIVNIHNDFIKLQQEKDIVKKNK